MLPMNSRGLRSSRPAGRDMACPAAEKAPLAPNVQKMYTVDNAGMIRSAGTLLVLLPLPGIRTTEATAPIAFERIPFGRLSHEVTGTSAR